MDPVHHFEAETVAAYAEGRLAPGERGPFEEHLVVCGPCREEVIAVRRLLHVRRTSRFRRPVFLAAAASAVLLVSLPLIWDGGGNQAGREPALRRSLSAPGSVVETLFPQSGSDVQGGAPLRFIWRDTGEGSRFRLTLMDEEGNLIWSTDTGDTTAAAPGTLPLESGRTYFWYVDALSPNGRSATSGPRSLRLR